MGKSGQEEERKGTGSKDNLMGSRLLLYRWSLFCGVDFELLATVCREEA